MDYDVKEEGMPNETYFLLNSDLQKLWIGLRCNQKPEFGEQYKINSVREHPRPFVGKGNPLKFLLSQTKVVLKYKLMLLLSD